MMNQTDMDSFSIPISMLRQFCFCRRIPYFILVRELQPPRGPWVQKGVDIHSYISKLLKRRDLNKLGILGKYDYKHNVRLFSQELGLHGICDSLFFTENELIPAEIKSGRFSRSDSAIVQLVAYAMVAEEQFQKHIKQGLIFYEERKTAVIEITQNERQRVKKIVHMIMDDCIRSLMPPTSASIPQCSQCEFLNFCADRL